VHRHMNRHSREISIVPAHLRAHTHMQRSLAHAVYLTAGGSTMIHSRSSYKCTYTDTQLCMFVCLLFWVYLTAVYLTLIRSRSLYNHINMHICVCVYVYICPFLSIPYSWLPNSLFLLDTGRLNCTITSCRPCHRTFLPGFHRLGECACCVFVSRCA
jgi:hypothetical protein